MLGRTIISCINPLISPLLRHNAIKLSTCSVNRHTYNTDEKTTVQILNLEPGLGLMVDAYTQEGFRLNNGMYVFGPMAIFPRTVLSWNVGGDDDINEASLSLFTILEPKLDMLIIGYGDTGLSKTNLDKTFLALRKQCQMNIEILPTPKAIATFNFLSSDKRWVAAALIPPRFIKLTDDDLTLAKKRYQSIYEKED